MILTTNFMDACKNGNVAAATSLIQDPGIDSTTLIEAVRVAMRTEQPELVRAMLPHVVSFQATLLKTMCWAAERGDTRTLAVVKDHKGAELVGTARLVETAAMHGHYDFLAALGTLHNKNALEWAWRAACRADQLDLVVALIQAPPEERSHTVTRPMLRIGLTEAARAGAMRVVNHLSRDLELARKTHKAMSNDPFLNHDQAAMDLLQATIEHHNLTSTTDQGASRPAHRKRL